MNVVGWPPLYSSGDGCAEILVEIILGHRIQCSQAFRLLRPADVTLSEMRRTEVVGHLLRIELRPDSHEEVAQPPG